MSIANISLEIRLRPLILLLLATALLAGCRDGVPDEPAGSPVSLMGAEIPTDLPESMREWAAWQRKGDRLAVAGDSNGAIYCFHKAEETFPKEKPRVAAESDLGRRQWSGFPVATYQAKAMLYSQSSADLEVARHYLKLAETHREDPADDLYLARVRASIAFTEQRYADARKEMEPYDSLDDMLFRAVCDLEGGNRAAISDIRRLYGAASRRGPVAQQAGRLNTTLVAWNRAAVLVQK